MSEIDLKSSPATLATSAALKKNIKDMIIVLNQL